MLWIGRIYEYAKSLGCTLITISHRPSLLKYHQLRLKLFGVDGKWELTRIETDETRQGEQQQEMEALEQRLVDVDKLESRLAEIDKELGVQR